MKKWERLFYLVAIVIEFSIILILSLLLKNIRERELNYPHNHYLSSQMQLMSFWAIDLSGEKQLIHFTEYSTDYYLITFISNDCHNCIDFQKKFYEYIKKKHMDKNLRILMLSTDHLDFVQNNDYHLKISFEDSIQFGTETPALFVVNGKGNVLFMNTGYYESLFNDAFSAFEEAKIHKSKSI